MIGQSAKKRKASKKNFIAGIVFAVVIIIGITVYYTCYKIPKVKKNTKDAVLQNIEESKVLVYQTKAPVEQGSQIKEDNLELRKCEKDQVPPEAVVDKKDIYTIKKDFGAKVARIYIPANTIMYSSILTEPNSVLTDDLKRQDFSYIKLNLNLKGEDYINDKGEHLKRKGDYVDIRIRRKDGTDDIVISKKYIVAIKEPSMTIDLSEEERNLLNYATVEAALIKAELYTVKYVDPENQKPAIVTYKITNEIKALIDKDPNIIKKSAKDLQQKYSEMSQNKEADTKQ